MYYLQQNTTNFLIQRKAYWRQQKLWEQLAGLQNPENQIIIQNDLLIQIIEEDTEDQVIQVIEEDSKEEDPELIMNNQQFNQMVTGLTNLTNAIQAQAIAPAPPAREASFAKIIDFYGDIQDPIRFWNCMSS